MKIGIDIDDTICNSIEELLPHICREYNLDYEKEKNKGYSYYEYQDLPNYIEFAKNNYHKILPQAPLKEGAAYYINKLYQDNKIIFITARGDKFFDNTYEICKEYLDKNKIKYNKLIVNAHEKGEICKKEKIDIFIDDSIRNCNSVSNNKIKVLLFNNKYNESETKYERVYNWKEIYDKIKNQQTS